jgi:ubiquinone/menaquinone biosynthesis C-methylase UbiE
MLRKLIDWNISVCDNIERNLPKNFGPSPSLKWRHTLSVVEKMNALPDQIVFDVGGGYICPFADMRREDLNTKFYMADISEDQLQMNEAADEKVTLDASKNLPIKNESIDIFVTRTLFEHFPENEILIQESSRILRKGGFAIHVFPCKFSPFAILNQIFPNSLSKKLLSIFFPNWSGEVGFKAFYKNCYYTSINRILKNNDFQIESINFNYYQSIYFKFFIPFYLISLTYDLILWKLNFRNLCCEILVIAKKRG